MYLHLANMTGKLSSQNPSNFVNPQKCSTNLDNPTLQITTEKLNGYNFLEWSLSIMLFLKSRHKMGYLRGTIKEAESLEQRGFWEAGS